MASVWVSKMAAKLATRPESFSSTREAVQWASQASARLVRRIALVFSRTQANLVHNVASARVSIPAQVMQSGAGAGGGRWWRELNRCCSCDTMLRLTCCDGARLYCAHCRSGYVCERLTRLAVHTRARVQVDWFSGLSRAFVASRGAVGVMMTLISTHSRVRRAECSACWC
jgi:hypothetical protein